RIIPYSENPGSVRRSPPSLEVLGRLGKRSALAGSTAQAIRPPRLDNSPFAEAPLARPQSRGPAAPLDDRHRSAHRRHNIHGRDRNPTPDTNSRCCSNNNNRRRSTRPADNASGTNSDRAVPDDRNGTLRIAYQTSDSFLHFTSLR